MKYDLANTYELNSARTYFDRLVKDKRVIELIRVTEKRTLQQNKYVHVLFSLWAIEYGYNMTEAKTIVKRQCPWMRYEKNGDQFLRSTADMTTDELGQFIDWFRNWSADNGYYLPSAEEYLANQYRIDNDIESKKAFM